MFTFEDVLQTGQEGMHCAEGSGCSHSDRHRLSMEALLRRGNEECGRSGSQSRWWLSKSTFIAGCKCSNRN
jgi:hypothetical protein